MLVRSDMFAILYLNSQTLIEQRVVFRLLPRRKERSRGVQAHARARWPSRARLR
jgi:hypothetical protein